MKNYKYELHAHTSGGSRCSRISAEELVAYFKERGYAGIFISDHLIGNTAVPAGTPWRERIELFFREGYERAAQAGAKVGLNVFCAPECSSFGNDFLMLGLSKEWWMQQEDFPDLTIYQQFDRVHEGGGFIIHAHPFLEAEWVEAIRLFPRHVDAVEVLNGGKPRAVNEMAYLYAKHYGLPMTAGTDIHSDAVTNLCGIETSYECRSDREIIQAIKNGDVKLFSAEQGDIIA